MQFKTLDKLFSVVIPIWRRPDQLHLILKYFDNQVYKNNDFEVILCDSFSGDSVDYVIRSFFNTPLSKELVILQVEQNSPSAKRNAGVNVAKGKWIIFLDDDCVPEENFLNEYRKGIQLINTNKTVLLGSIEYPQNLVETENYYRYRQSRHLGRWRKDVDYSCIPFNNLTTMNMCINREAILIYGVQFDPSYDFYREDIDYALQLKEKEFLLSFIPASIKHLETTRTIRGYSEKLEKVRLGETMLENKWGNFSKNLMYSKSRIGYIRKVASLPIVSDFLFNKFFVSIVLIFLEKTNTKKYAYFPFLYHFVVYSRFFKKHK